MINRFSGEIWIKYSLFKKVCPHYIELHNIVLNKIKSETRGIIKNDIKIIEAGWWDWYTTKVILDSDSRITVFSIDNDEKMTKILKKNFWKNTRVKILFDDILSFLQKQKTNSFDAFVSGFTLHNFNYKYRKLVLIEIYRVIRSGWFFINADKYAISNVSEHRKNLDWQLNKFKLFDNDLLEKEWIKHYIVDEKEDIIMFEKKKINDLKNIWFKNIKIIYRKKMEAIIFCKV